MKLKIKKIISSGEGIGWAENKTFFVPFVLPEEEIEVIDYKKEKSFFRVTDFKLLKTSKKRRKPVCKNFTKCGGCSFLHIDYKFQLEIKKQILFETFKQNKIELKIEPEILFLDEFGYRTRAKINFIEKKPAFRERFSHKFVPFENCPLLFPKLNEAILNDAKKDKKGEVQYEYSISRENWLPDKKFVFKKVFDKELRVSNGSFFQSSEKSAEILVSLFLEELKKINPDNFLDLFSGIGLFSLFASDFVSNITGAEISKTSAKDFKYNLKSLASLKKIDCQKIDSLENFDLILADPPRSGIKAKTIKAISKSKTKNLISISCNVSTFVRDLGLLKKEGFKLKRLVLLDLFPNTHHFEIFAVLKR